MSELDDFFAKKDKSKKKSKSKKDIGGDVVDGKPKEKKKTKKIKPDDVVEITQTAPAVTSTKQKQGTDNNDDAQMEIAVDNEWNDYDADERDYTGLKIQSLQIGDQNEENKETKEDDGTGGSDEETGEQGPWANVGTPTVVAPRPRPVTPPVVPVAPSNDEAKKPSKYMTPAQRAGLIAPPAGATPLSSGGGWRNRKRNAPNITSEAEFPTLGDASDSLNYPVVGGGTFEQVKSGGRQIGDPSTTRNQVEIGNKYDALQGSHN